MIVATGPPFPYYVRTIDLGSYDCVRLGVPGCVVFAMWGSQGSNGDFAERRWRGLIGARVFRRICIACLPSMQVRSR